MRGRSRLVTVAVGAALLVAGAGQAGAKAPGRRVTSCFQRVQGLGLAWYPSATNGYPALAQHGVVPAPELFDALAVDYARHHRIGAYGRPTTARPNVQDFLLVWLPVWMNGVANGQAANTHGPDLNRPADLGKLLWLAHVAGYYGGVWLRKDFLDFDLPVHGGIPFGNDGINRFYTSFVDPLRRAASSPNGATALSEARGTLRTMVEPLDGVDSSTLVSEVLPPDDDLAGFAYDAAWLTNILPPHPDAPQHAAPGVPSLFRRDPNALLDAHYGIPEQPVLTAARRAYAAVTSAGGSVGARYRQTVQGGAGEVPLLVQQHRFDANGQLVYGVGIPAASSYRGYTQEQYDRVLTWAAYATMQNLANALNALTAYATQDVGLARTELRATAVWSAYVGSYGWGHLNAKVTNTTPMSALLPSFRLGC